MRDRESGVVSFLFRVPDAAATNLETTALSRLT